MKRLFLSLSMILVAVCALAADAVNWTITLVDDKTDHPSVKISAKINPGYHLYAVDNPAGGSMPLQFYFDVKGCKTVGQPVANKKYTTEFDDIFEVNQHFYDGSVTFTQKLQPTAKDYSVNVEIQGQACNDTGCVQVGTAKMVKGTFAGAKAEESKDAEKAEEEMAADATTEAADSLATAAPAAAKLAGTEADKCW